MPIIENFAALSAQEQRAFAETLLKTINSERIFSDQTNFELVDLETSDFTGGLYIHVAQTNPMEVARKATWQAADEDEKPHYSDIDYDNDIDEDVLKEFKTGSAIIDGYKVELEIDDVDEDLYPVDFEVERVRHEDSGIGRYEFWGDVGYDSRPYIEIDGVIISSCDCALTFYVEPNDASEEPVEGPVEASPDKPVPEVE